LYGSLSLRDIRDSSVHFWSVHINGSEDPSKERDAKCRDALSLTRRNVVSSQLPAPRACSRPRALGCFLSDDLTRNLCYSTLKHPTIFQINLIILSLDRTILGKSIALVLSFFSELCFKFDIHCTLVHCSIVM
jgi:hypothetical protein